MPERAAPTLVNRTSGDIPPNSVCLVDGYRREDEDSPLAGDARQYTVAQSPSGIVYVTDHRVNSEGRFLPVLDWPAIVQLDPGETYSIWDELGPVDQEWFLGPDGDRCWLLVSDPITTDGYVRGYVMPKPHGGVTMLGKTIGSHAIGVTQPIDVWRRRADGLEETTGQTVQAYNRFGEAKANDFIHYQWINRRFEITQAMCP